MRVGETWVNKCTVKIFYINRLVLFFYFPEFYEALQNAFEIGNWDSERVAFDLPYLHGDKTSILEDAIVSCDMLGLDFDVVLKNTITSYNPDVNGKSSGQSGSDIERILAFHAIGRKDPIEYQDSWDNVLKNALLVESIHQSGDL